MIKEIFNGEFSFIKYIIYLYCLNFISPLLKLFLYEGTIGVIHFISLDILGLWREIFWLIENYQPIFYSLEGSSITLLPLFYINLFLMILAIFPIVYRCINKDPQITSLSIFLTLHFLSGISFYFITWDDKILLFFVYFAILTPLLVSSFYTNKISNTNRKLSGNLFDDLD
tara:strand:+ start:140 stop:652 length:513 start_codon:yes stop_codon:yes gene_type:complete